MPVWIRVVVVVVFAVVTGAISGLIEWDVGQAVRFGLFMLAFQAVVQVLDIRRRRNRRRPDE